MTLPMKFITNSMMYFTAVIAFSNHAETLPDPSLTEVWQTVNKVSITDGIPSDAIVLFDGTNLEQWHHDKDQPVQWTLSNGAMTVKPGTKGIATKEKFCDAQLHIEWRTPSLTEHKTAQNDGNSGIYIQGRYEVQVLNSFNNDTYANGQAGSIYKQSIPLVNASKPPMVWQSYDIIFKAPTFNKQGQLSEHAYITVLHNGVLIQNNVKILGSTTYRGEPMYKAHGCAPIYLQDHGSEVSYRNIWLRKL